ncbi:hypothetical protein BX070DRAFT_230997 [Coemansia spiralis]|nr:hypothetical protein BX070DRAFT_230997 [Coemansia spiralis]
MGTVFTLILAPVGAFAMSAQSAPTLQEPESRGINANPFSPGTSFNTFPNEPQATSSPMTIKLASGGFVASDGKPSSSIS